ncbi:MAG: 50S ribosomal protein L17, partial [Flavobacteriales bacterium]|nr:50S ribosomal protein L17 [Flavobacteriales bacterium]
MRHGKKFNHLGRKAAHRKAMLANMACSLIEHKKIKTTLSKAKALRLYVEPLITKSKNDTTHSRRTVFSYLKQKEAITELFGDVASKVAERPGGYTRILKLSNRLGDNAQMAFIELVDYNETYTTDKPKKKKARRSGGGSKTTETAVVTETVVAEEVATENVTTEVVEVEEKTEEVVETAEVVEETVAEVTEEKDTTEEIKEEESNDSSDAEKAE